MPKSYFFLAFSKTKSKILSEFRDFPCSTLPRLPGDAGWDFGMFVVIFSRSGDVPCGGMRRKLEKRVRGFVLTYAGPVHTSFGADPTGGCRETIRAVKSDKFFQADGNFRSVSGDSIRESLVKPNGTANSRKKIATRALRELFLDNYWSDRHEKWSA